MYSSLVQDCSGGDFSENLSAGYLSIPVDGNKRMTL